MSAPMDEQRLAEIQTRVDAATSGPWELCPSYGSDFYANVSGPHLRGVGTFVFGDGTEAEADKALVLHAAKDMADLVAEVWRLREERHSTNEALDDAVQALKERDLQIAELENYEQLNPQQCPKGLHADWLVDSEYAHACPWCRIAELEALTPAPIQTCRTCGAGYNLGQPCQVCAYRALVAAELKRQQEDPHDGPLASRYTTPHDLPEVTPDVTTGQCGYDDYHDAHEWADKPHVRCPGHSYETDAEVTP
ncbi:hypothetical protein ACFQ67_00325 [Streptomyces sp. NPDC056488]|uniref:hypothetical protein n=1 Tax=Streptomyces sp. NPDC056488 TaxID=3345836 RepID=UPI00368830E5